MFTAAELDIYLTQLGISSEGRRVIERARRESPVRDVQSHIGNVITHFQSEKMGRAFDIESLSIEHPAVVRYEHDRSVLEYYAQPLRIDLKITDEGARRAFRLVHVPDFLLLTTTRVIIEEWREEKRLLTIAREHPGRIYRDETGHWRSPHIEAHLGPLGIDYRLRSGEEHPRIFVQNMIFLRDYLSSGCPPLDQRAVDAIRSCFRDRAYMTVGELIACGAPTGSGAHDTATIPALISPFSPDDVYKAIARKHVAFDLDNELISDTHRSPVYRDPDVMAFAANIEHSPTLADLVSSTSIEVGSKIVYEDQSYAVQLLGQDNATLLGEGGITEIAVSTLLHLHSQGKVTIAPSAMPHSNESDLEELHALTPQEVARANKRADLLRLAEVNPDAVTVSLRTLQRWRKATRLAVGAAARNLTLVGNERKRGNRLRKMSPKIIDLIHQVTKHYYNTPTARTKQGAYRKFVQQCQAEQVLPCSYAAFSRELKTGASVRKREGKRRAYQDDPIVWYLYAHEPIHGVRPFEFVHIDHTQLEIILHSPHFPQALDKPWLTLAIDAESREIVGFYLTFESPSYRSCMMVLRDIVRRHGRLPGTFVVDNGPDLTSENFQSVCDLYRVDIRWRPAAKPRHGTVVERSFGTTTTQLIYNMEGNTKLMRHVRSVTKSVRPEQFAVWTLPALAGALDYYFREIYGADPHPAHHEPPREHLKRRLIETGLRTQRLQRLDRNFLIQTCPTVDRKGTRFVDGQRGVKIAYIWYWTDAFRHGWHGREIPVRIDPWDARVCYVLLNNVWHQCISKLTNELRTLTRVELESYYDEMTKRGGAKKQPLTPERIAEWTKVLDASAFDARLRVTQDEAKRTWEGLGMTTVEPSIAPEAALRGALPYASKDASPADESTGHLQVDNHVESQQGDSEYDLY